MKHSAIRALIALFAVTQSAASYAAEYKVDPSHSRVGFAVKHLVAKTKGQFKEFDGTFNFDPAKPEAATGKFVVKTASVWTDNEKRDEHLKGAEFFDVQKYPEMTLDKVKLKKGKGKDKFTLTGELSLHGVTKPVSFDVEFGGVAKDPWGNSRAGFSAEGKINRQDYGIKWNKALDAGGFILGDEVTIELNVEGIEEKPAEKK